MTVLLPATVIEERPDSDSNRTRRVLAASAGFAARGEHQLPKPAEKHYILILSILQIGFFNNESAV